MSNDSFVGRLLGAHAEIEVHLNELERADGAAAMAEVLERFSTLSAKHQADEEKILFPRLKALPAFAQALGAIDFQHQMNAREQTAFAEAIRGFAPGRESELRRSAHRFAEVQRAHMLAEERALFPLVEQSLPADVLHEMANEMASVGLRNA